MNLLMTLIFLFFSGGIKSNANPHDSLPTTTNTTFRQRHRQQEEKCDLLPAENIQRAWDWASNTFPRATGMIVYQNGVKQYEAYEMANICPLVCQFPIIRQLFQFVVGKLFQTPFGGSPTERFSLFSMTKSFAGLIALLLEKQGLIESLDERVSAYLPEWQNDANKSQITIRELLTLSSGIWTTNESFSDRWASGGLFGPFIGKKWAYGAQPYQVFSELTKRVSGGRDAQQYLNDELFSKLNIHTPTLARSFDWTSLPGLSTGAKATLPDMATLGLELLDALRGNGQIFGPSDVEKLAIPGLNPAFGLSFWLNAKGPDQSGLSSVRPAYPACGMDVIRAAGFGGQVMVIVPEQEIVVVKSSFVGITVPFDLSFTFFDLLFENQNCRCFS